MGSGEGAAENGVAERSPDGAGVSWCDVAPKSVVFPPTVGVETDGVESNESGVATGVVVVSLGENEAVSVEVFAVSFGPELDSGSLGVSVGVAVELAVLVVAGPYSMPPLSLLALSKVAGEALVGALVLLVSLKDEATGVELSVFDEDEAAMLTPAVL